MKFAGGSSWIPEIRNRLQKLWLPLSGSILRIGPGLRVRANEAVCTYVRYKSHLDRTNKCVRHEHFLPRAVNGRLEFSLSRTRGISLAMVWKTCAEFFEKSGKNHVIALGISPAAPVYDAGMSFDPDGDPHPRHCNLIGWRDSKFEQKQQALRFHKHFKTIDRSSRPSSAQA